LQESVKVAKRRGRTHTHTHTECALTYARGDGDEDCRSSSGRSRGSSVAMPIHARDGDDTQVLSAPHAELRLVPGGLWAPRRDGRHAPRAVEEELCLRRWDGRVVRCEEAQLGLLRDVARWRTRLWDTPARGARVWSVGGGARPRGTGIVTKSAGSCWEGRHEGCRQSLWEDARCGEREFRRVVNANFGGPSAWRMLSSLRQLLACLPVRAAGRPTASVNMHGPRGFDPHSTCG
jgi:hypothetical protein